MNVFVDDWRGFRLVYDTEDVRFCKNDCINCPLFNLLKNEKSNQFTPTLYRANSEDKGMFGPQNYLNCKTITQYQSCFISFIINKCKTREKIFEELDLVRNLKLIYSKNADPKKEERDFKKGIIEKAIFLSPFEKKFIIQDYLNHNKIW